MLHDATDAGQLLLVFLTIFPVVDLHILVQAEGLASICLGLAVIVAGAACDFSTACDHM